VFMSLLMSDDVLVKTDGAFAPVESIKFLGHGKIAQITCEGHTFSFGGIVGHNFPVVTQ